MGFGLVRDNSVLEPLDSGEGGCGGVIGGQWSRATPDGSNGGKVSLSNGTTSKRNKGKQKATPLIGLEILTLIDDNEQLINNQQTKSMSIFFQLKHNDRLYTRYFKHMNAGRNKVSLLIFI